MDKLLILALALALALPPPPWPWRSAGRQPADGLDPFWRMIFSGELTESLELELFFPRWKRLGASLQLSPIQTPAGSV